MCRRSLDELPLPDLLLFLQTNHRGPQKNGIAPGEFLKHVVS